MNISLKLLKGFQEPTRILLYLAHLETPELFDSVRVTESELFQLFEKKIIEKDYRTGGYKLKEDKPLTKDELKDNITKLRKLWSRQNTGLAGKMGDKHAALDKLKKWMSENDEYTIADIYNACKYYIQHYRDISTYLVRFDYFIFKYKDGTHASWLSSVIDEALEEGVDVSSSMSTI